MPNILNFEIVIAMQRLVKRIVMRVMKIIKIRIRFLKRIIKKILSLIRLSNLTSSLVFVSCLEYSIFLNVGNATWHLNSLLCLQFLHLNWTAPMRPASFLHLPKYLHYCYTPQDSLLVFQN